MIKYINSKESLENKMRNCQERKAKSTKMEYRGETTRKLVNIQSVRVLEIENIENQTGSKNKTNHNQVSKCLVILNSNNESSKTVK